MILAGACILALKTLESDIRHTATDAMVAAMADAEANAKATPLFKGSAEGTRATIHGIPNGYQGTLRAGGAAFFLENGTKPHVIAAKGNGVLRFVINGVTLFRHGVLHPGTQRRPFMSIASDVGEGSLVHHLERFVDEAIAKS